MEIRRSDGDLFTLTVEFCGTRYLPHISPMSVDLRSTVTTGLVGVFPILALQGSRGSGRGGR